MHDGCHAPRFNLGYLSKMRGEPSLLEKSSAAIAEFEDSIGSETYDISSSFRAGPVLPFDFIDAKSGRTEELF